MGQQPRLTAQSFKVLALLMSRLNDEVSGAEVCRATGLRSGTLYPILMRFEEAGWLESRWEVEDPHVLGRPRRRLYKVTAIGIANAKQAIKDVVVPFQELAWN